ncbi:TraB/GumN family protein [Sediminicola sp. 1XM1-17]|uniref:TraB/GumN family protein n=1 Tax=Sediminicola sp. 1XM1-17 TaxID=3127702 RepID=UPI003076DD34
MRFFVALAIIFNIVGSVAQDNNSLLWEISGNGLEQSSYLYGTMHVSKKIAFRLDDVFYEALEQSDMVALESDPDTWLDDEEGLYDSGYGQGANFAAKGFYIYPFLVKNPKKEDIAAYLAFEDRLINTILYRSDGFSGNFEEETYLDMFIYQAGRKLNKPIIALEELAESTALVGRANLNALKPKPDEWLQKTIQQQDPIVLIQDAYRERNINFIDSINQAIYSKYYLKNMLYERNLQMVQRLDSIMKKGKVFTGIGAAHLPGNKGVIALLRDKGYTVEPLTSKLSSKGRRIKEQLEKQVMVNNYGETRPDDDFFSILLPSKLYPISELTNTTYIAPDLANGSYFMVNRIPTHSFLKKDARFTIEDIDRFLFENIPGKISEKTALFKDGYYGLDVKNELKNGDRQRYQIYITPLEILIFKMGGQGDYVTQYSDTIFNSIKFKKITAQKELVSSGYKDFQVKMPSLYTFPNRYRNGARSLEGHDQNTGAYFFLKKVTLNDFNFIEEDSFELKQIQQRFYDDLALDPKFGKVTDKSLRSAAPFSSGQKLHLKTVINGGDYYLLGALTNSDLEANSYFNSFSLHQSVYSEPFEKVKDTALYFTTVSNVVPPKFVENSNHYYAGKNKPKPYSPFVKKTLYLNKNNEAITVELSKAHDYLMFPSIDSVWALRKKIYSNRNFTIHDEQSSVSPKGYYELNLSLGDSASSTRIMVKNIAKGGLMYELKTNTDTLVEPTAFVTEFFDNFKPMDTLIGRDLMEDKVPDFFKALRERDSISMDGIRFLHFTRKHLDSLMHYISDFNFREDQKNIQATLIQKMGEIDDPAVFPFFRTFYVNSYNNSNAQTKILQAISKKADDSSTELLLDLMSKDLPLISNKLEIHTIFKPYMENLELASKLYPQILDYSTIEEYNSPIFSILADLVSKGMIKPKRYKKYSKQILNDAKLQLKRHLGQWISPDSQKRFFSNTQLQNTNILEDYEILLYPFIKDKEVQQFFNRLLLSNDPKIRTTYVTLLAQDNKNIPFGMIDSLAANINSRSLLFNKVKDMDKLYLFPVQYRTQQQLAEASFFDQEEYDASRNTIQYLTSKKLEYENKEYTGYYFKLRNNQDYDDGYQMYLVVYSNDQGLHTKPFYKSQGLRIEDTETDLELIDLVTEEFMLKDRQRAIVYRPYQFSSYNQFGF